MSNPKERGHCSIFDLPSNFFDGCHLISSASDVLEPRIPLPSDSYTAVTQDDGVPCISDANCLQRDIAPSSRLTCNTCRVEFESLLDQRFHFKSDIHRLNVKLSIAGKGIISSEDFDELVSDVFDVSSVSGSEDETYGIHRDNDSRTKQMLVFRLGNGDRVSLWKCLLLRDGEDGDDESDDYGAKVVERLNNLINEDRNGTKLRIVLLACGGHFAGSVFDGSAVVAHKTFHRYVVRAKAGKKQSSKDASGRFAHSAGAALRRHNELGLKKDIQELLAAWKQYFERCDCVFVHAPSSNLQLLFDGEKPYFSGNAAVVRHVPMSVRRPTFKESKSVYNKLTQLVYESDEMEQNDIGNGNSLLVEQNLQDILHLEEINNDSRVRNVSDMPNGDSEKRNETEDVIAATPLHEAARSGDAGWTMQLLEQGYDPRAKDERGRTPYMLASEKETRNAFRRFMALNPEKWDWNAAKVPSALTKEMEESQAAKQAEKEAKRKARNKELKKLRKAREKKAQENASSSSNSAVLPSKEEELQNSIAIEREKRAAAAEKRMLAAAKAASDSKERASESVCSCCSSSLEGIVPFHRYSYRYCSSSCMHVHREIIESG